MKPVVVRLCDCHSKTKLVIEAVEHPDYPSFSSFGLVRTYLTSS